MNGFWLKDKVVLKENVKYSNNNGKFVIEWYT